MREIGTEGVIYGDGTMISTAKYAQLDPGWLEAGIYYFLLQHHYISPHEFGTTPAEKTIDDRKPLEIAILGDWGTGNYPDGDLPEAPALTVLNTAKGKADVGIHLGDVYYAGNSSNEREKFIELWNLNAAP